MSRALAGLRERGAHWKQGAAQRRVENKEQRPPERRPDRQRLIEEQDRACL